MHVRPTNYLCHHDNYLTTYYARTMSERCYYTYIVASRTCVLYVGVIGDIERRMIEHKASAFRGFTAQYRCNRLVWFERYSSPSAAIAREKQLKGWIRAKKLALIERQNPTWIDLSENWGKPISFSAPASRDRLLFSHSPPTSS